MSFSLEARIEAAAFPMKKPCCRRAFINGILISGAEVCDETVSLYVESAAVAEICSHIIKDQFGRDTEPQKIGKRGAMLIQFNSKSASEFLCSIDGIDVTRFYKCPECQSSFLRGLFVAGGTVSEPDKKDYHFEIKSRLKKDFSDLLDVFLDAGFELKVSERLGKPSLYAKDSGTISDFLFFIGANKQAFDFMNAKISHEIKNDINRRTNCETSNIARATASAAKHIAAIKYLSEHGRLSELGPELEYTAKMRLKYPEMSLVQLGQAMTPAVSKPGLYHRLEKIYSFSENLKNKEV
ncbi:MAG: DNA-binding protein WhiA [Clostridia bacterium]|nr:DNA-binding protein WhiA [Clostridia bacterium]